MISPIKKLFFPLFLMVFFVSNINVPPSWAKAKANKLNPIPGKILRDSKGIKIFLDQDRSLLWPDQGWLVLQDPKGKPLANIDLTKATKKAKSDQALGLEVSETDLGGNVTSKRYLKGKKQPKGRSLNPAFLEQSALEQTGKISQKSIGGVKITLTQFPNGAQKINFSWPDQSQEEVFFDKRKTLINRSQTRRFSGMESRLEQWIEGSFERRYTQPTGSLSYTFDAQDQSYRLVFNSAQGGVVKEIICRESCQVEM